MINYNNRKFRSVSNSYTYSGSKIRHGHLIALVDEDGSLDIRYHQVNAAGQLMIGTCHHP
ncbi:hypothetical protein C900_01717 [Fulvivirga imtechensis AK7]|uniref:Uncharacterized protein n=1 Tax=Fulvivirga imtechensis AK7 TaxID=1237149 RepID=L8JVE2_9BACT|nr:hypothetical protein C900_01717 [Fulvivirga imtechensis AK7]